MTKKKTPARKKTASQQQETAQSTLKAEDEPQVQSALRAESVAHDRSAIGFTGQQTLDLGSILGGLMSGTSPASSYPSSRGIGGGILDGLIGPLVDNVARKLGIPRELAMMGAVFLISKLLGGALGSQMPQQTPQMPSGPQGQMPGEIDLGSILGGLLGGMTGMPPASSQGSVGAPPSGDVLGKIGQAMPNADQPQSGQPGGIHIQGLTVDNAGQFLGDSKLTSEFAQFAGVEHETAARSLAALLEAMSGRKE